jgi:hypothetical protein
MKKAKIETLKMPWSRRQRLRYIEGLAYWRGSFRRADLLRRFDIGAQRVSDDIRDYLRLNAGSLTYDRQAKVYRATAGMTPIFGQLELEEALPLLGSRESNAGPWWERVKAPTRKADARVMQQVFRAVSAGKSLQIRYASLNSATDRDRWITPHAFAHDGYRWHVRAFCHEEKVFKDFVIGRIARVLATGEGAAKPSQDRDWARTVQLTLAATVSSAAELHALELDFGCRRGKLVLRSREALALYVLAQLGLEPNGAPLPKRFTLERRPTV